MKLGTSYLPRSGCSSGASGLAPNSGSSTGCSTSYSTSIRSTAFSAISSLIAPPPHGIAHISNAIAREDVPIGQVQARQARELFAGHDRFHARQLPGLLYVYRFDQRMRVRAAHDAGVQHSRPKLNIVGEDRRARYLVIRFYPWHAIADR